MNVVEQLKAIGTISVTKSYYSSLSAELEEKIDTVNEIIEVHGVEVFSEFEDGGRWSNYETSVYEVTDGKQVGYFRILKEVPATEMQEGGDFLWEFDEVEPFEVTTTQYRRKRVDA